MKIKNVIIDFLAQNNLKFIFRLEKKMIHPQTHLNVDDNKEKLNVLKRTV